MCRTLEGLSTISTVKLRKVSRDGIISDSGDFRMVPPAGVEPATPGLGNLCSILLS